MSNIILRSERAEKTSAGYRITFEIAPEDFEEGEDIPDDISQRLSQKQTAGMALAAAVVLSIYFSRRFTSPIQTIKEAMTGFDGNDFERKIDLHTNTELDEIGRSYNEMLDNIRRLLDEIKEQEKELRC